LRYLIISDLHANLEALQAVLADAGRRGFDRTVCLGDLVGYAADPNEVIAEVRRLEPVIVRGNHDKVISGVESGDQFNVLALRSCEWTRDALTEENRQYLAGLPRGPLPVDGAFWIAHGTPLDEDAYILNDFDAIEVFRDFPEEVCFFGHSHLPTVFALSDPEGFYLMSPMEDEESLALKPGWRYLVNCGSVGQPRDRNPKAAYGIYDAAARRLELVRVPYDVQETQRKILATDLPPFLADRLAFGV
jgi:diadenosine tetraphosphatase ApaH/serine/threonine PP2A family protein phosphatase